MPRAPEPTARDAAILAERALSRTLVVAGAVLLVLFFLPWVVKSSRFLFAWNLIRGGSLGRVVFLFWIPIAGVNFLALGLVRHLDAALRAGLAIAVGLVPMVALCATRLTFGQPPAAVPDTVGYGLLAAMPLLSFGLHHRAAHPRSRAARSTVVLGAALVVASFLIPRETDAGAVLPLPWLFERASQSVGWAGVAVYLVLPIPFALVALAGLSPSARWNKPLRLLQWYFLRFIPGLFLLMAFPALSADQAEVYRPYVLYVGAAITAYLSCSVAGASALLARLYGSRRPRKSASPA